MTTPRADLPIEAVGEGMHTMTAIAASAPPRLPVWSTVRASYAIVARNLGQLVRICWLWVLIMVAVHAALDWLEVTWSGESGGQAMYRWMREIAAALPSPIDLPFLASIAVAWHRLVLREERVTQPAYLRLDGVVGRYVLYSFAFLLLERGTLAICAFLGKILAVDLSAGLQIEFLAAPIAVGAAMAIGLLVLPRLSLRHAWSITRGNTLRLGMVTALCMLPAVTLAMLVSLLMVLVRAPWWLDFSWPQIVALMWAWMSVWGLAIQLSQSSAYAIFTALAYAVLTIFGVTLLSLTYRFFALAREARTLAMNGRRVRYVGMTLGSMLLLAWLLLLIAASLPHIPRSWWYWSYMRQADSYGSEIEKFKTEHGYYPDENDQKIVELSESNPYFYESDGKQYCVGFSVGFDDTYRFCSTTQKWTYGAGPNPFRHKEAPK